MDDIYEDDYTDDRRTDVHKRKVASLVDFNGD